MSDAQTIALKMMDVMDSVDAFDFNERRRFFQQRLRYWRGIVRSLRLDLAVFAFSGHVVYDYVIYELSSVGPHAQVETPFTMRCYSRWKTQVGSRRSVRVERPSRRIVARTWPPELSNRTARLRGRYEEAVPWYRRNS